MKSEAPNNSNFTLARPATPVYPLQAPRFGVLTEIAPGILCLRMIALDHINLFLLKSGEGWLIVDTGPATAEVIAIWELLFPDGHPNSPTHGHLKLLHLN